MQNTKIMDSTDLLISIIVAGLICFLSVIFTYGLTEQSFKLDAIHHHAAHYAVSDDGSTEFEWNNEITK